MWLNPQFPAVLVTFTEETLNEKLHFLCIEIFGTNFLSPLNIFEWMYFKFKTNFSLPILVLKIEILSFISSLNEFQAGVFFIFRYCFLDSFFPKVHYHEKSKSKLLKLCNIELTAINNHGSDDKSLGNAYKHISRMLERANLSNILVHTNLHIFIFLWKITDKNVRLQILIKSWRYNNILALLVLYLHDKIYVN